MSYHNPVLRLHIVSAAPLRADVVGGVIERVSVGFSGFQRRRGARLAPYTLRVQHVHVGSLIADLVSVGEAIETLINNRDLLGGFIAQLGEALNWLTGLPGAKKPNPADRTTVETLASPIARDGATQVVLQLVGDNNTVLIITPEAVAAMKEKRATDVAEQMKPVQQTVEEAVAAVQRSFDIHAKLSPAQRASLHGARQKPRIRAASRRVGTMVHLQGRWYVRPEGMNGALLPVQNVEMARQLVPTGTYLVEGEINITESLPTSFTLITVEG